MIRAGSGAGRRARGILSSSNLNLSSYSTSNSKCSPSLILTSTINQISSFSTTVSPSSYKPSFRNPRATKSKSKKRLPNWKVEERSLRSELSLLEQRLSILDKRTKSDDLEKDLPPLDEASLDEIHAALMLPDAATPEEKRMANQAFKRRIENANTIARGMLDRGSGVEKLEKKEVVLSAASQIENTFAEDGLSNFDRDLPPPSSSTSSSLETLFTSTPTYSSSSQHLSRPRLLALRLQTFSDRLRSISDSTSIGTSEEGRIASEIEQQRVGISQRLKELIRNKEDVVQSESFQQEMERLGEKETDSKNPKVPKAMQKDLERMELEGRNENQLDLADDPNAGPISSFLDQPSDSNPQVILNELERIISSNEIQAGKVGGSDVSVERTQEEGQEREALPMGFATPQEWTALAVSFVSTKRKDGSPVKAQWRGASEKKEVLTRRSSSHLFPFSIPLSLSHSIPMLS